MDKNLGEVATKNGGMRNQDSRCVMCVGWECHQSDLIEGRNENRKRRDIRATFGKEIQWGLMT